MTDQNQPQAIKAEESLLGALLISAEMIPRVKAFLSPDAFFLKRHATLYKAILYVYSQKRIVDLVILNEYLEATKALDDIGGPGYITGLIEVTITSYHAMAYADEIQAAYIKRLTIDRASRLVQEIYSSNGNYQEVISAGLKALRVVANQGSNDSQTLDLRSSNDYYLDVIARRQAAKDDPKLKFHCWPGLSKLMPELGIGDLVAVLAESGVGKTVFLEQCAEDWARRGWRVAFFHLELNSQTMLDRRMTQSWFCRWFKSTWHMISLLFVSNRNYIQNIRMFVRAL
jgi:replicative DNA helicase